MPVRTPDTSACGHTICALGIGEVTLPPLYERPPRPLAMARWLITKFFWWQNGLWIAVGVVAWLWLTPSLDRFATLAIWVIGLVYLRNVALMVAIVGGLHWWLYANNVIWTVPASGGLGNVAYTAVLTVAVFPLVSVHFYANHRLLHTQLLYRMAHSLHHHNVNIGPWTGVAMHPVEHVLYFSAPLMFLLIPGNPYLVTLTATYLLLSPAPSHSGFDRHVIAGGRTVDGGDRFHTLHHRYFDCNYGTSLVPLDKWFGTWHDGSDAATERVVERRRRLAAR